MISGETLKFGAKLLFSEHAVPVSAAGFGEKMAL
jgi:hypothetical protein